MSGLETGAIIAIVGASVSAVSTGYAFAASRAQGAYQVETENQNRKLALLAAEDAIRRGDIAEQNQRTRTRLLIAEQQAGFAASGVEIGSGSALSVTADTAQFGELDALTIRNNAQREAWGYLSQAADFTRRADAARSSTYYGKGSTLLTGGSQLLNIYASQIK